MGFYGHTEFAPLFQLWLLEKLELLVFSLRPEEMAKSDEKLNRQGIYIETMCQVCSLVEKLNNSIGSTNFRVNVHSVDPVFKGHPF